MKKILKVNVKASSVPVENMRENGYITMDEQYYLFFTDKGYNMALET